MNFNYTIPIETEVNEAWEKVQNPNDMIQCLPGIEEVTESEHNQFQVVISTKFGPVKLCLNGRAKVSSEKDRNMKADVMMTDSFSGSVYGIFTMDLEGAEGEQATNLLIHADVNIAGKLGEFAQPLIKRKADQIIKEFTENLKSHIA